MLNMQVSAKQVALSNKKTDDAGVESHEQRFMYLGTNLFKQYTEETCIAKSVSSEAEDHCKTGIS